MSSRKIASRPGKGKNVLVDGDTRKGGSENFKWGEAACLKFVQLCLDENSKGNKNGGSFNRPGWGFIIKNFNEQTGNMLHKSQIKNHWYKLKKDYSLWRQLMRKETGIGWDEKKKCIDAPDEWWVRKINQNPNYEQFRYKDCSMYDNEYAVLFQDSLATGDMARAPSQSCDIPFASTQRSTTTYDDFFNVEMAGDGGGDDGEGSGDSDDKNEDNILDPMQFSGLSSKRPSDDNATYVGRKKKKPATREIISGQMEQILNHMGNRSSSTINYPPQGATSAECLQLLRECEGVEPGTSFWFSASTILMSANAREMFVAQPDSVCRLSWMLSLISEKNARMSKN